VPLSLYPQPDDADIAIAALTADAPELAPEILAPEILAPEILALQRAAAAGNPQAQFELAVAYEKGEAVDRDLAWAARWYGEAAYRGHAESQYTYGKLKLDGKVLPHDPGEAYRWLTLSGLQGHDEAKDLSRDVKRSIGFDVYYREQTRVERFEPINGIAPWDPPSVEYLQLKLGKLGYSPGPPDGVLGPRTASALEAYQANEGLPLSSQPSEALLRILRSTAPQ